MSYYRLHLYEIFGLNLLFGDGGPSYSLLGKGVFDYSLVSLIFFLARIRSQDFPVRLIQPQEYVLQFFKTPLFLLLFLIEQRQYKNDSIQSKLILLLKLLRFSPHRIGIFLD